MDVLGAVGYGWTKENGKGWSGRKQTAGSNGFSQGWWSPNMQAPNCYLGFPSTLGGRRHVVGVVSAQERRVHRFQHNFFLLEFTQHHMDI